MNMSRMKHACMSVMFECSAATFVHWAILGRFDQRLHRQGECFLRRHIVCRFQTLQSSVVLAMLSIYEYKCLLLLTDLLAALREVPIMLHQY